MTKWKVVSERDKYGIAIFNFKEKGKFCLELQVGEAVYIIKESGEWYFGCTANNRDCHGIFPKSFIQIRESVVDKSGPVEMIVPNHSPIVLEITAVLREWGVLWKQLYVTRHSEYEKIQKMMLELMRCRTKILSGNLPVDEIKDIKQLVTSKIDLGNNTLGLDMVVRDEQGNILNPMLTSAIQLYMYHDCATKRIKGSHTKTNKVVTHHSHIFFVSIRNFVCKMTEDADLLMMLYDAKEGKPITESYVVRWSREGLAQDVDQINNLRVLFTDLGQRDLRRDKVYLVCFVVRIGAMEAKELDIKRASQMPRKTPALTDCIRRPCGVAALDVTLYLKGGIETNEDTHIPVPFTPCGDKDNLDGTLKKILAGKDMNQKEPKGQGLWTSLKLLHGDLKQVREENPHLVLGSVAIARKMGFPEIILPGDVRNDLYLTLVCGEFSRGSKSTDKNVEVTVRVCNEKGQSIPGVIMLGAGVSPQDEYRSVVYYHEDKPKWFETLKIAVPIDEFKSCHIKFYFKHRSSNEAKDKSEKIYAISYVKLMQDNGTTLPDTVHDLLVYKVDHKKFDESDLGYLKLPSTKSDLAEGQKPQISGLSISTKDNLTIQTNVCSTKLTQNVDLLGLLKWAGQPEKLQDSLKALMKVDGEEIVKFLQDVLDALFNILMQNSDSDMYDKMVFECLLHIINLVSSGKYQHFQPVLDLYIKESFSATLAYHKLMHVLKQYIDEADQEIANLDSDILHRAMKSLQYIIKFIVRSRILHAELNEGQGEEDFSYSLRGLLQSMINLMSYTNKHIVVHQASCLKYLPTTIPDILEVFSPTDLSQMLLSMIFSLQGTHLATQKMYTLKDIVLSELFLDPECRSILLPSILKQVREMLDNSNEARFGLESRNRSKAKIAKVLGAFEENILGDGDLILDEMSMCVQILSDLMELLFQKKAGQTMDDITLIMQTILRTVIQTTIRLPRKNELNKSLVSIMIAVFRQMTPNHFEQYFEHFSTRIDLLDFLMEILSAFRDLVSVPVYPNDWCDMIMLQNSVILKSLRYFSHNIRDYFTNQFEKQVWNNFFHCAIAFLTQPALQLDSFSANKRARIISRYKDMRRETAFEIRVMWFNLGSHKIQFIPELVGPFLEMTMIPEVELRKATIPIFFDMMQCEFYSSKSEEDNIMRMDTKKDSSQIKANFCKFEDEMIAKLDSLVEGGKGDHQYKDLFNSILLELSKSHSTMSIQGQHFVETMTKLMECLLEYRNVVTEENKENRMSCTVNVLNFYNQINRKEMYIRYVNKLYELHLECENFTEAAYTLKLHSKLLLWSNSKTSLLLRSSRSPEHRTHRELKEKIYNDMIDNFDRGKMWECALEICKELIVQYEQETYEYVKLSELHKRMAVFYQKIIEQIRPEPEYFRVAFYGRGFPSFLQNKVYVYRGKEYERLSDFSSRTQLQFPNAELMKKLVPPGEDITESDKQYLQINKVDPVMNENEYNFSGKNVNESIVKFYRVNEVRKFRYSRPFHKEPRDPDNEFASLWLARTVLTTEESFPGILHWFPVDSCETHHLSPIVNAIEDMEASIKSLRDLIVYHANNPTQLCSNLSMKLNGVVEPAVNGGIKKYEKAFFTGDYLEANPDQETGIAMLKNLMACQIPVIEIGLDLHRRLVPEDMVPFHQKIEEQFVLLKDEVESKYGKRKCDQQLEQLISSAPVVRRQFSRTSTICELPSRMSEVSLLAEAGAGVSISVTNAQGGGSTSGGAQAATTQRSRVSSLTRSNLKNLTNFDFTKSFTNLHTGTLGRNSGLKASSSSTPVQKLFPRNLPNSASPSKREKKRDKDKSRRKTSASTLSIPPSPGTQWYTENEGSSPQQGSTPISSSTTPPVFELRQELTPKRPLRSEVEKEKRLSRPNSGSFTMRFSTLSLTPSKNGSNRDSIVTTDSTASEEDFNIPPPLPAKQRVEAAEPDYCNLPDDEDVLRKPPLPNNFSKVVRKKLPPPEPEDDERPPTPPPKKPVTKFPTDHL
ncbi:dedicator of cytokinesis protein 1 [Neocloeon triangulifer]|uniref:dedicator of cytokinesis protein 1 n=1 Tax=Neocloeon triangulifer TaxID=2078957 RepID=UPI00286FAC5C|nr:dedicator of cytokinesis protein 1 [Neocloeon triangulifer]